MKTNNDTKQNPRLTTCSYDNLLRIFSPRELSQMNNENSGQFERKLHNIGISKKRIPTRSEQKPSLAQIFFFLIT